MLILLMCLYAFLTSGQLGSKLQGIMDHLTGGSESEENELPTEKVVETLTTSPSDVTIETLSEESGSDEADEHSRKKRRIDHHTNLTRQTDFMTKHVDQCPAVGYFFRREFVGDGKVCYLCFCKENDLAICWPRDNKRCDTESFHYHRVGKREQRHRRSPGFTDVFFRDATREILNKQTPEQCKPHEASYSEGCPPADWCIGCTVCDCDANGRWDCHILSFCTEDDKQKLAKKKLQISQMQRQKKLKVASPEQKKMVLRATKEIYSGKMPNRPVPQRRTDFEEYKQLKNSNVKKNLANHRRSPQVIKKGQKPERRHAAHVSPVKSRQKKIARNPNQNKNKTQKRPFIKKRNPSVTHSKKIQVNRSPNQARKKVLKPRVKNIQSWPSEKPQPNKPHPTKPQPTKRAATKKKFHKKGTKRHSKGNSTASVKAPAILTKDLQKQLQQELNRKILEAVEKMTKQRLPPMTKPENNVKVKRSASLMKHVKIIKSNSVDGKGSRKMTYSVPLRKKSKIVVDKSNKLHFRRPKRNIDSETNTTVLIGNMELASSTVPVDAQPLSSNVVPIGDITNDYYTYTHDDSNTTVVDNELATETMSGNNFKRSSYNHGEDPSTLTVIKLNESELSLDDSTYPVKGLEINNSDSATEHPTLGTVYVTGAELNEIEESTPMIVVVSDEENKENFARGTGTAKYENDFHHRMDSSTAIVQQTGEYYSNDQVTPSDNDYYVTGTDIETIPNTTEIPKDFLTTEHPNESDKLILVQSEATDYELHSVATNFTTEPIIIIETEKEDQGTTEANKVSLLFTDYINDTNTDKQSDWSYKVIEDSNDPSSTTEITELNTDFSIGSSTYNYKELVYKNSIVFENQTTSQQSVNEQQPTIEPLLFKTSEAWTQTPLEKMKTKNNELNTTDLQMKRSNKIHDHENHTTFNDTGKHFEFKEILRTFEKRTPKAQTDAVLRFESHIDITKKRYATQSTTEMSDVPILDNIVIDREKNNDKRMLVESYTKAAYKVDDAENISESVYFSPENRFPETVISLEEQNRKSNNKTKHKIVDNLITRINDLEISEPAIKLRSKEKNRAITPPTELMTNIVATVIDTDNPTQLNVIDIAQHTITDFSDKETRIREQRFSTVNYYNTTAKNDIKQNVSLGSLNEKISFKKRYDVKKIQVSPKKHRVPKLVTTLYKRSWRNEKNSIHDERKSVTANKASDLKSFFNKLLNSFSSKSGSRKPSKANKFKIIKYLQKFFKKIFTNGKKKNKTVNAVLNKKNVMKSLCATFGPCHINNRIKAKLYHMIELLNKETVTMLKTIKIIKGLLRLVDLGKNETTVIIKSRKTKFKNDVQKLHNILRDYYRGDPPLGNLSDSQKMQVNYIRNNTQEFVQSAARFTMILNHIIQLITVPANKSVNSNLNVEQRVKTDMKRNISPKYTKKLVSDKSEVLRKLKDLVSKYNLVQSSFMRKMLRILSNIDNKASSRKTQRSTESSTPTNKTEAIQVYARNIIQNLRKLKSLAQTSNTHRRRKREADNAESVEYLLMLMEYLLKQTRSETNQVTDGIDLIIDAIKRAPDIKPIKNKVFGKFNNQRYHTNLHTKKETKQMLKRPAFVFKKKQKYTEHSSMENSRADDLFIKKYNLTNTQDNSKINTIDDDFDEPYPLYKSSYKYPQRRIENTKDLVRYDVVTKRINAEHIIKKPLVQNLDENVEKMEYETQRPIIEEIEQVIKKFPYEDPVKKLKEDIEIFPQQAPVQELKQDVEKLEKNLQVLKEDFQTLKKAQKAQSDMSQMSDVRVIPATSPTVLTRYAPDVTEFSTDFVIPDRNIHLASVNTSEKSAESGSGGGGGGGGYDDRDLFNMDVEDDVFTSGYQSDNTTTVPPTDSTIPVDVVSMKVVANNDDVSMSMSKTRLDWLDERYEEEMKAQLNQSKDSEHSTIKPGALTTEAGKDRKKNLDVSDLSKEVREDSAKEKMITEELLRKKNLDLLNSLDYGTEKVDADTSASKESIAEDKYSGDSFSWYFDT